MAKNWILFAYSLKFLLDANRLLLDILWLMITCSNKDNKVLLDNMMLDQYSYLSFLDYYFESLNYPIVFFLVEY
jgi:hypothetical protein